MASHGWNDDESPFGGEAVGANPTDRAKGGTKRLLLTDGAGVPLSIASRRPINRARTSFAWSCRGKQLSTRSTARDCWAA
jgi:hypothetical protein